MFRNISFVTLASQTASKRKKLAQAREKPASCPGKRKNPAEEHQ